MLIPTKQDSSGKKRIMNEKSSMELLEDVVIEEIDAA